MLEIVEQIKHIWFACIFYRVSVNRGNLIILIYSVTIFLKEFRKEEEARKLQNGNSVPQHQKVQLLSRPQRMPLFMELFLS